jgi:hypothetical protein
MVLVRFKAGQTLAPAVGRVSYLGENKWEAQDLEAQVFLSSYLLLNTPPPNAA